MLAVRLPDLSGFDGEPDPAEHHRRDVIGEEAKATLIVWAGCIPTA